MEFQVVLLRVLTLRLSSGTGPVSLFGAPLGLNWPERRVFMLLGPFTHVNTLHRRRAGAATGKTASRVHREREARRIGEEEDLDLAGEAKALTLC